MREMKDSGIRFVGNIPSNWKIEKNKHCFEMEKEIVGKDSTNIQLLSLTKKGIICKDLNSIGGKVPESFDTYQKVKKGQIILCLFDLDCSAVFSGLSNYNGMISPAYKAYNCCENIHNRYAMYWFDFCFHGRKYMSYSKSLRYVVNADDFKDIEIILPPIEEQIKIVNFLDEKVGEIDKIIEETKETIEEYKIYKQTIITNAVTKGLSQNVKMKDSGSDYIGEIPAHWDTIKLSYISKDIGDGLHGTPIYNDSGEYYFINGNNLGERDIVIKSNTNKVSKEEYEKYKILLNNQTILISLNGTIGNMSFYNNEKIMLSKSAGYINLMEGINKTYIYYFLKSNVAQNIFQLSFAGTTINNLSLETLRGVKIIYPPADEQIKIVNYLNKITSEIDKAIKLKESIIIELESYKKSLIYEYVTGKKEVKETSIADETKLEGKKVNCTDNIFAQAILLCKIIEKLNKYNLGRVKAEKTLYLIEKELGFDFSNNYVREKAGPLAQPIYKCETIISKKNKWVKVKKVKQHIEYEILSDFNKYKKYYNNYYSGYDDKIEKVIDIIKDCSKDKAEMIATLYASWNDFIIKGEKVSDIEIVKDVRENWNDSKKRFNEETWLNALNEMKKIGLVPKGHGNLTVIKEQ